MLVLSTIGGVGLTFAYPLFQGSNAPRPPLQTSGDMMAIVLENRADDDPIVWTTLDIAAPHSEKPSRIELIIQADSDGDQNTIAGTVLF